MCCAFNCVLRSIIIQLILSFSVFPITYFIYIDHLIGCLFGNHSIGTVLNHSIDLNLLNHSIGSLVMPVTTGSKSKSLCHPKTTANSVCLPTSNITTDNSTLFIIDKGKDIFLMSSDVHGVDNSCDSSFHNLEISNFQTEALVLPSSSLKLSHNLKLECSVRMESDCKETISLSNDNQMVSNQEDIIKLLTAISDRMMTNYQDIQQQLHTTDSHYT